MLLRQAREAYVKQFFRSQMDNTKTEQKTGKLDRFHTNQTILQTGKIHKISRLQMNLDRTLLTHPGFLSLLIMVLIMRI
jgi:hypothetical protein